MGVTGLWTVLQPTARPIKIETLNRKRLAVDASIWIYQFLKAVRDKEGNALRNSHVVGFFRRICKLLFIGIKPVFVFDGGAPALKRQTISNRKKRREGRRDDAVRTAGKLLAVQMHRRAEEEEKRRREQREAARHMRAEEKEVIPEDAIYAEEVNMTPLERQKQRKFKKTDQYHLPTLDVSLSEMGGPDDPRIMSLEELQDYARQFEAGEDINVYDFSKIDFDSPFFVSLPASDRYNILNAARLRSRLRMGYSKDQLDTMFPDRMAFSRFQIERVTERNELTQRLMNINGMNDDGMWGINGPGRVAGEKGREYVLVKNDGVEGGWALGVVGSKDEGQRNKPIDVDKPVPPAVSENGSDEGEDDDFEDVPVEGLNRLPRQDQRVTATEQSYRQDNVASDLARRRQQIYKSRKKAATARSNGTADEDPESLFVGDEAAGGGVDESAGENDEFFQPQEETQEDSELQKAIAMSLQQDGPDEEDDDEFREVFQQRRVNDAKPFTKGSGLAIAKMANSKSSQAAKAVAATSEDEEDALDFQTAIRNSRSTKRKRSPIQTSESQKPDIAPSIGGPPPATETAKTHGFDGPLPFEKLDLGTSLLGKKKMQKIEEDNAGGFEKDLSGQKKKKKKSEPLPPWFSGDLEEDLSKQKEREAEQRQQDRDKLAEEFEFQKRQPRLRKEETGEVIDLEADDEQDQDATVVEVSDDGGLNPKETADVVDDQLRMGDMADKLRAEPITVDSIEPDDVGAHAEEGVRSEHDRASDGEPLDWEDSDHETKKDDAEKSDLPATETRASRQPSKSSSPEFEEVEINEEDVTRSERDNDSKPEDTNIEPDSLIPASGLADQTAVDPTMLEDGEEQEVYSDPEDEELFQQLAEENEEHARFASSLNNNSSAFTAEDYERELKALRTQQKKDRRDADEVTQTMISECQQLLTLFGLPYVEAPMEAEAQCAELVRLGLVDGVVTDDSDIFLFGGTRVYKNMFNQAKFVECYLGNDISSELGLDRQKLIAVAQLLGSDYTEGLPGVGPVSAMELLSEFGDLTTFRDWWAAVQSGIDPAQQTPFRRKFRKSHATKLFLPPAFPDTRVEEAYLKPDVDDDPQPFAWGVPDLNALRSFLMATIGWGRERADEVLVPVIRDMNRREVEGTQSNITRFFEGGAGTGSVRVRASKPATAATRDNQTNDDGDGADAAAVGASPNAGKGSKRLLGALGRMRDRASHNTSATATEIPTASSTNSSTPATKKTRKSKKRDENGSAGTAASNGNESARHDGDDNDAARDDRDDSDTDDGDAEYVEESSSKKKASSKKAGKKNATRRTGGKKS